MNSTHGGQREGAGRKPTGRSNRKTLFLSDTTINILQRSKNPSELVDQAIVLAYGGTDKLTKVEGEITSGQLHFRLLAQPYVEKYMAAHAIKVKSRFPSQEHENAENEINQIVKKLQEECFANFYTHLDPITGASLNNKTISDSYLAYLNYIGKTKEENGLDVELPLERFYYDDESDGFSCVYDHHLAFQGGLNYDRTFYWVFHLLSEKEASSRNFEIYYYPKDGIIRAQQGSSRLLAHVLLGEKTVKPEKLFIVDAEPDSSFNQILLEVEAFLQKSKHELDFMQPLSKYDEHHYLLKADPLFMEEYVNFIKNFWSAFQSSENEELKHCVNLALSEERLSWNGGYARERYQTIYEIAALATEINKLLNPSLINPELILNLKSAWAGHPVATSLERWFFKKYVPMRR